MDFQYYINILLRRKWAILLTALLAAVLAYFLATNMPPTYKTQATLETGVLNYDGGDDTPIGYVPEYQINARFDNLVQEFRSRKMLRLEAFKLLIHDLGSDDATIAFRKPEGKLENISPDEIASLVSVLKKKIKTNDPALDPESDHTFSALTKAYGYDIESLQKKLEVARIKKTDYLKIGYVSKNPAMGAYLVNNLAKDYISMNSFDKFQDRNTLIANYAQLTKEKKAELDSISQVRTSYMRRMSVTDKTQESKMLVNNLTEAENNLSTARKNKRTAEIAIRRVKDEIELLKSSGSSVDSDNRSNSQAVAALREDINKMQSDYIGGGQSDKKLKAKILAQKENLQNLIKNTSGSLTSNHQKDTKRLDALEKRKLDLFIQLQNAEQGIDQYTTAISNLNRKIPNLVHNDTRLDDLAAERERIDDQYRDLADKLSAARAGKTNQKTPLKVVEYAQIPDKAKSNKPALVAAFSGIGAGSLATILIFLLSFFDSKLSNANQFKQLAKLPLIGSLPFVKKGLIPGRLFQENIDSLIPFKESLRALRYQLEESHENTFLFTSMKCGDGKTFVIGALVEALAANGKKVLVIDTNFRDNSLSKQVPKGTMQYGIILQKLISEYSMGDTFSTQADIGESKMALFDLLGNVGRAGTPTEVLAGKDFGGFLEELEELYDFIIMEGAALAQFSDSKELTQYADRVVSVFASNASLDSNDKDAITYLRSLGDEFLGAVLNGVDPKSLN